MDEFEGAIYDGDLAVVPDVTVLLDGDTDGPGWHAHVALPLGVLLEPGVVMRLVLTDGRSGPVELADVPVVEGDRVLHVLDGTGALAR